MREFLEQSWERRSKRRFLIEQDVRYEHLQGARILSVGIGKTVDISSRALRFTTATPLRTGDKVKVTVNWPVLLDATCPLKMVIYGRVLRSDGNSATVRIGQHELRTRAAGQSAFLLSLSDGDQRAML